MWTFVFYILQPSPGSNLNSTTQWHHRQQQQQQRSNESGNYEMAKTTTEEAAVLEGELEKGGPSMYPLQVKTSLPQVQVNNLGWSTYLASLHSPRVYLSQVFTRWSVAHASAMYCKYTDYYPKYLVRVALIPETRTVLPNFKIGDDWYFYCVILKKHSWIQSHFIMHFKKMNVCSTTVFIECMSCIYWRPWSAFFLSLSFSVCTTYSEAPPSTKKLKRERELALRSRFRHFDTLSSWNPRSCIWWHKIS